MTQELTTRRVGHTRTHTHTVLTHTQYLITNTHTPKQWIGLHDTHVQYLKRIRHTRTHAHTHTHIHTHTQVNKESDRVYEEVKRKKKTKGEGGV